MHALCVNSDSSHARRQSRLFLLRSIVPKSASSMSEDAPADMKVSPDAATVPDIQEKASTSKSACKPVLLDVRSNVHFVTLVCQLSCLSSHDDS
jgi:hypothetical protein